MTLSSPIRAVFFDLDGTLIATANGFYKALDKLGFEPPIFDAMACFLAGVDWRALIDYLYRHEPSRITQIREEMDRFYQEHLLELTDFYPNAYETLQILQDAGYYTAIISNKTHRICEKMHKCFQFPIHFLLGSEKIPFKKPHPAPIIQACLSLQVHPRECLYIGDMPSDMEAARWSGCQGVYARYGLYHYFHPSYQSDTFMNIDSFDDLLNIVRAHGIYKKF